MNHVYFLPENPNDPLPEDCAGPVISAGYNLISDSPGDCVISGDTSGNLTGIAASLGSLTDNGGLTRTHVLLADSPAIDAANPAGCKADADNQLPLAEVNLTTDQRGSPRPTDGDDNGSVICDMGAVELIGGGDDVIFSSGFE